MRLRNGEQWTGKKLTKETVIDGQTGFLVPVKNVKLLIEKMVFFIKNLDKCDQMGKASYNYCLNKYDVKVINKSIISAMEV